MKKRSFLTGFLAFIALLAAAHAALPVVALRIANQQLAKVGDYRGQIGRVGIQLWRGAYTFENVSFVKMNGQVPVPFFEAERIDVSLQWKALLHGEAVGDVALENPRINFVADPDRSREQLDVDEPGWQKRLLDAMPFRVNRFTVRGGEVHFRNYSAEPKIDLYLHGIAAEADNLSNAKDVKRRLKATIHAAGKAMTRGAFDVFLAIDPLAEKPDFEMRAALKAHLPELNDFFRHYLAVEARDGQIDIFVEGSAKNGQFDGYVKPLIEGLSVLKIKSESIGETIKGVFAKIAAVIFKNQEKKDLATKVDIAGSFDDPEIDVWGALTTFVRNAFYKAVLPGFEGSAHIPIDAVKLAKP